MTLKEWLILITIIAPVCALILKLGHNSVSEKSKEKAGKFCERTVMQSLSVKVEWEEAQFLQLGTTSKYTSNDGLLFVWEDTSGKKEIKCTTSLNAKEIRFFSVNGENLTSIIRREEREK